MNTPKPSFSVNVDVANPGQFFACCGLLELAHRLWPGAEGWFREKQFHVSVESKQDDDHLQEILRAVTHCTVEPFGPDSADPKIKPIKINAPVNMVLAWWLNADGSVNPWFKTWAANASSLQMFCKWQQPLSKLSDQILKNPSKIFEESFKIQGSYGFDSHMGWNALDVGFSLNEHNHLKKLPLRPAVELFSAIGLERFFPSFNKANDNVSYALWIAPLSPLVAACVVNGSVPAFNHCVFKATFARRGNFKGLNFATSIGERS